MTTCALLLPGSGTQLRRAALAALAAGCSPVIASGAEAQEQLAGLPVDVIEDGSMSALLRVALEIVPHLDAALALRVDPPLATTPMISRLIARYRSSRSSIVAAAYGNTIGIPAIFGREVFPDLLALPAENGIQPVLAAHAAAVETLSMLQAGSVVESASEYADLRGR